MKLDRHSLGRIALWAVTGILALSATIRQGYAQGGGPPGGEIPTVAIDPATPSTLYAGTFEGGLFKSTNGGTSWFAVNSGLTKSWIVGLAIDSSSPTTLYAGTVGGGIFKSINGGASWTAIQLRRPREHHCCRSGR